MDTAKPRICLLSAFKQGYELLCYVIEKKYSLSFVATCHCDDSEFEEQISDLCERSKIRTFRKINANERDFTKTLREERIDVVILAWWPDIIKKEAIKSVKIGWLNLHPSYLPYGRGKHAYFWSIIEKTPFGVSIHFIDEGVDTGKVLFQRRIPFSIEDTGESLYKKGVEEVIKLFKEKCDDIMTLNLKPIEQDNKITTSHFAKEIEEISTIKLEKSYKAIDLIDIIRARSFINKPSAYFYYNDEKYYIRLDIEKTNKSDSIISKESM